MQRRDNNKQFRDFFNDSQVNTCWKTINWKVFTSKLSELQQELVKFYSIGNFQEVSRIQHIILTSRFTHALGIKKVLNNKKGKTPGIDGIKWDTNKKRWDGVILCWHIM